MGMVRATQTIAELVDIHMSAKQDQGHGRGHGVAMSPSGARRGVTQSRRRTRRHEIAGRSVREGPCRDFTIDGADLVELVCSTR